MMIVLESGLENFKNAILSKGLDPSDFELEQMEAPMQGGDVQLIVGQAKGGDYK